MIEEHGMGAKLSSRRGSSFLYIKDGCYDAGNGDNERKDL